jgi:hypothetical protein
VTPQEAVVVLMAVDRESTLFAATQALVELQTIREPLPPGQIYDWHARSGQLLTFMVRERRDGGLHGSASGSRVEKPRLPRRAKTFVDAIQHLRSEHERTIALWSFTENLTLWDATREFLAEVRAQHQPTPGCSWEWDRVRGQVIELVPGPDVDLDDYARELNLSDAELAQLDAVRAPILADLAARQLTRAEKRGSPAALVDAQRKLWRSS